MTRLLKRGLLVLSIVLVAIGGAVIILLETSWGRAQIVAAIESATEGEPISLRIGSLSGDLPGAAVFQGVELTDGRGRFATLDLLSVDLDLSALLQGNLAFESLDAAGGRLERLPQPAQVPAVAQTGDPVSLRFDPPAFGISIGRLSVTDAVIDAAVLGQPMAVSAELSGGVSAGDARVLGWVEATPDAGPVLRVDLDGAVVPRTGELRASFQIEEAPGGVAAGLLGLDDRSALSLSLTGGGALDCWQGVLSGGFGAGAQLDLALTLAVGTGGIDASVEGRIDAERLVAPAHRPLMAGGLEASMRIGADRDGRVSLETLNLRAPGGRFDATAATDPSGIPITADVRATLSSLAPFADILGRPIDGRADMTLRLRDGGRQVTAVSTGQITVDGLTVDGFGLEVSGQADQALATIPADLDLRVDARLPVPRHDELDLPSLLGQALVFSAEAQLDTRTLQVTVDRYELAADGLDVVGAGVLSAEDGFATSFTATLPALDRLRPLSGLDLAGSATVDVTALVPLDAPRLDASVSMTTEALSFGAPALDALVGPRALLVAGVSVDTEGRASARDIDMRLAAMTLRGGASVASDPDSAGARNLDGRVDLVIPDTSALAPIAGVPLRGAVSAAVALAGTVSRPVASASWRAQPIRVSDITLDRFSGSATASLNGGAVSGNVRAQGDIADETVDLAVGYRLVGSRLEVSDLVLEGIATAATGRAIVDLDAQRAVGALSVEIQDLGRLGAAFRLPLAGGRGRADLILDGDTGQDLSADASLEDLALAEGPRFSRIQAVARLSDVASGISGRMNLSLRGGDAVIDEADLEVGFVEGRAAVAVSAVGTLGVPYTARAAASLPVSPSLGDLTLERLDATLGSVVLSQTQPAAVSWDPALRVDGLDIAVGEGRIVGAATLDPLSLAAEIDLRAIPADVLLLADPRADYSGVLNGRLQLSGVRENPVVRAAVSTPGIRPRDPRFSDLPPLVFDASLQVDQRQVTVSADATLGEGAAAALRAATELGAGPESGFPELSLTAPLSGRVTADADLARAAVYLPIDYVSLAGKLSLDVAASGTVGAPDLAGSARLDGGSIDVIDIGLYLRDVTLEAVGEGNRLVLRTLSARSAGGGVLTGQGWLSAEPATGLAARIDLSARGLTVVNVDEASIATDLDMILKGGDGSYQLAGAVTVLPTVIQIPDALPPSVVELEVVEVRGGRIIKTAESAAGPIVDESSVMLDVDVLIPGQVFVRGRGLDSEWAGAIDVTGSISAPMVVGEISVQRGSFDALGRIFAVERGRVVFDRGAPDDPTLDMRLTTTVTDISAAVVVSGTVSRPDIVLGSEPALPEEDILSRLLFGSDKAELSALQALQLARSAAILSGQFGAGDGVTGQVRDALGVDTVEVDTAAAEDGSVGAALSVGKYVAPGVFLKLQQGLSVESTRAVVEVDVGENVSVETDVGAASQGRVGVNWKLDY